MATITVDEKAAIHDVYDGLTVVTRCDGSDDAPLPITRVADIYDYTDLYSYAMEYAAGYYKRVFDGLIDVRYHRMQALPIAACSAIDNLTTPGVLGIKCCEEIKDGTAGSTALSWVQTGPNAWGIFSNLYFHFAAPEWDAGRHPGMAGKFLAVHELGHTFGNLPHRTEEPYSAMSAVGTYAWDYLVDFEIAACKALMPTWDVTEANAAPLPPGLRSRAAASYLACDLPRF
jgi:hypothetical protein